MLPSQGIVVWSALIGALTVLCQLTIQIESATTGETAAASAVAASVPAQVAGSVSLDGAQITIKQVVDQPKTRRRRASGSDRRRFMAKNGAAASTPSEIIKKHAISASESKNYQRRASEAGGNDEQSSRAINADGWHPHSLEPTFTDQEQGDEMIALASEQEPETQVKVAPQVKMAAYDERHPHQSHHQLHQQQQQPSSAKRLRQQTALPMDEYYSDEDDEDEGETAPFKPMNVSVNRTRERSSLVEQPGGWLPTSVSEQPQQSHQEQPQQQQQQQQQQQVVRSTHRPQGAEKLVSLFGGREVYGGGSVSKTDLAIEYLKNILRNKQAGAGNGSNRTSGAEQSAYPAGGDGIKFMPQTTSFGESGEVKGPFLAEGISMQAKSYQQKEPAFMPIISTTQAVTTERIPTTASNQPQQSKIHSEIQAQMDRHMATVQELAPLASPPSGTPLGGDYIESLDEYPRGLPARVNPAHKMPNVPALAAQTPLAAAAPIAQSSAVQSQSLSTLAPQSIASNQQQQQQQDLEGSQTKLAPALAQTDDSQKPGANHLLWAQTAPPYGLQPMSGTPTQSRFFQIAADAQSLQKTQNQQQLVSPQPTDGQASPPVQPELTVEEAQRAAGFGAAPAPNKTEFAADLGGSQVRALLKQAHQVPIDQASYPEVQKQPQQEQQPPANEPISSKLYKSFASLNKQTSQANIPKAPSDGQQPVTLHQRPQYHHYNHHHHYQHYQQHQQQNQQQQVMQPPPVSTEQPHKHQTQKVKPKIVSYNYYESPNEKAGEGEQTPTNFQLGDALYGSNGGVEQMLSATELEAIQSQFMTADHPMVPISQQHGSISPLSDSQQDSSLPDGPESLQKLISPSKQAEESLKELASNDEPSSVMIQPQQVPPPRIVQQESMSGQREVSLLQKEKRQMDKSADLEKDLDKKRSLIVYLNHPRPVDMAASSANGERLAQTIADQSSSDPFLLAKEFDSHGFSKDGKNFDATVKDSQEKDGLSVVVIGDAYKYKKIVLMISSKSGGLKFIPMVKDMKR